MRLIDADRLEPHEQLEPMGNGEYEYVEVVYKDDIDDALTIDAVPVVRCKDCKKYRKEEYGYCVEHCQYGWADESYCSDGERKEE